MATTLNIRLPDEWHAELKREASANGKTVSRWLLSLAYDASRPATKKRLDKVPLRAAHRPKKEDK